MVDNLNLTAFCIGAGTAYYALAAYHLLWGEERATTRLHKVLGYMFLFWLVANTKDIVLTFPGVYSRSTLDLIMLTDGWSGIGYAALLFEITMPGWANLRRLILLSLPFMLFTVAYFACPSHGLIIAYGVFLSIFGVSTLVIGCYRARRYMSYIRANYSNIDGLSIDWLNKFCLLCFLGQALWLLTSIVGNHWIDCAYYLVTICLWHTMYVHCRNLRQVVPVEPDEPTAAPERDYAFAADVDGVMAEGRLWLDPNLSLGDLARRLSTNRTYLSDYFSSVKRTTFYDYVNALRIERESVPLVVNHPEYTLEYIARQSGFNSLSTFRRAFRKFTGHNPGHYRDKGATAEG